MPAKQHRVTRGDDYRRITRSGRRVGGSLCITHAVLHAPGSTARFGFIVSKAVGGAVVRNLVRRRLKAIVERHLQTGFDGAEIVFRALPPSATASFADLDREVSRVLERVRRMHLSESIT